MGTYYSGLGISSGMIGAAVALCVVHDVVVNDLGLQGFPSIMVDRYGDDTFRVDLRFGERKSQTIWLSNAEAKAAVEKMREGTKYDATIFERVQLALANLEGDR